MNSLKVLLTNNRLAARGGSELSLRDVASGLLRRGHRPVAYSTTLGSVAAELRALTIPVVSDLNDVGEAPDVIHGHHHYETMTALLHFPNTPAVSFCRGWLPWQEAPPLFPRISRYVAVDDVCRERLLFENGVPAEKITLLLNTVDLTRFRPRDPLPAAPKRALVFSNGLWGGNGVDAIREACSREGLDLDVMGLAAGSGVDHPEAVLPGYDLVFGKARAALEALAVGCAVIVCDVAGLGGMVTQETLPTLRRLNFGIRTLSRPLDPGLLSQEIRRFSAEDATVVSASIRATAGLDTALDELIELYQAAVAEFRHHTPDPRAELRAAAAYLRRWSADFKGSAEAAAEADQQGRDPHASSGIGRAEVGSDRSAVVVSLLAEIPLTELVPVEGRVECPIGTRTPARIAIRTVPLPWHYAATLDLSLPTRFDETAGFIRLQLRVHGGAIGVGLLDSTRQRFLSRQHLADTHEAVEVLLPFRRLGDAASLVVQSWDQPVAGMVEVESITVHVSCAPPP